METPLENVLLTLHKPAMISHMASHPVDFREAIELAVADKQPFSWRAAWLLWSCMEDNDHRIRGHIPRIIDCLPHKNDGHQRELIKILMRMELPEEHEGMLFDLCMNVWEQINKTPSVRHNAFRMIIRIASRYPELYKEIGFITQEHYLQPLSPGVRRAVFRMIRESGIH
jgi:hypothetical protein